MCCQLEGDRLLTSIYETDVETDFVNISGRGAGGGDWSGGGGGGGGGGRRGGGGVKVRVGGGVVEGAG